MPKIGSWGSRNKCKEEIMLDLQKLAEQFIQDRPQSFNANFPGDEPAIRAISITSGNSADREKSLLAWLHGYKVLRSFTPEISQKIAEQIIEYADNREQMTLNQNKDLIIQEYGKLESQIHRVIPLNPKSRTIREITSLTSKALWCCYPGDIPILDDHAERALQVISRICNLAPDPDQSRFAAFIDVWFQVYNEITPVINQANLNSFTYKIRVLDWLLWYLGKPSFDKRKA
jgi:hypothetical protein